MEYELILLAAGQGKRMQLKKNKIWLEIGGKPLFMHSLALFLADERCKQIILICREEEQSELRSVLKRDMKTYSDRITLVSGGAERQWSVGCGLDHCSGERPILIHDGARPFLDKVVVERILICLTQSDAVICGVPAKDTIKRVKQSVVVETPDRSELWQVQTPQGFQPNVIKLAHKIAKKEKYLGTDDASLVEYIGKRVEMVEGSYHNIKLTTPDDIVIAKAILKARRGDRA